jgi:hypothetical protein
MQRIEIRSTMMLVNNLPIPVDVACETKAGYGTTSGVVASIRCLLAHSLIRLASLRLHADRC